MSRNKAIKAAVAFCFFWMAMNLESRAQVVVKEKPSVPDVVMAKPTQPGPNSIWIDGHWKWDKKKKKYVWVPGHWMKARPNRYWVPGHWATVPEGVVWIPGHWTRISRVKM